MIIIGVSGNGLILKRIYSYGRRQNRKKGSGIWAGYREGCGGRYGIYLTGGIMLAFVGAEILVRYL